MKIIIIGGGPAGVEAALTASKIVADVTMVTNGRVGEWKSALPNLWLTSVKEIIAKKTFSLPGLEQRRRDWENNLKQKLKQTNVHIVLGKAAFHTSSTLKVILNEGGETHISGDKIIIANGSRPTFQGKIKPDGKRIFSYQTLNTLQTIPSSIIIIGDSPIGYEMVNLFNQIGSKVKWLLPVHNQASFDEDITTYLKTYYEKNGVEIISGPYVHELINNGKFVTAVREDGETITAEYAFITLGFTPNVDNLNIQKTNLKVNEYGSINTNEYGQTSNSSIYVVGDAQMPFSAVSSMAKAHVAALHASTKEVDPLDIKTVPLSFNENPQVSTVGRVDEGEPGMTAITVPYDARQFRAFMTGETEGFLKIVYNKDKEIVGGTCIGSEAKDIISIIALMVKLKVKTTQVATFFGSHPSATELPFILLRETFLTKDHS